MEIINLDVSGQLFSVQKDTLLKIPYFNNLFNDCDEIPKTIFVARPPNIFKHVIGYVIDNLYPYPAKYTFELDFYGIEYNDLYTDKLLIAISALSNKMDDINKEMKSNFNEYVCSIGGSTKCEDLDCDMDVFGIYCSEHLKCVFEGCINAPIKHENYCEGHDGIGLLCCRQGCRLGRTRRYFCYSHTKK